MAEKKRYWVKKPEDYLTLETALDKNKEAMEVSGEDDIHGHYKIRYHFNDSTVELIGRVWNAFIGPPKPVNSVFYSCSVDIYARDLTQIEDTKSKLEEITRVKLK
ncbi:hypothetical protein HYT23_03515 [Candidatus Pacearchaeota archaeon]|nr:hypothetical protein [Candidatus Pacearchaeota archaeon]